MKFSSVETELLFLMQGRVLAAEAERIACVGSWWRNMETDEAGWSDGVFRIFGVSREDFKPSFEAFMSTVYPPDRPEVATRVKRTLASAEPIDFEHRIVRPDGEIRYVHERAQLITIKRMGPKFLLGAVHDITESKHLKKGWFAAIDTARELSNPLTTLMLSLDAARRLQDLGHAGNEKQIHRALNMAQSSAHDIARLVRLLRRTQLNSGN